MDFLHHREALVPRQQRFTHYTRSLMQCLEIPVWNEWGLRPAVVKGTKNIAPLTPFRDLDKKGLLNNEDTLSLHAHLPQYALTNDDGKALQVLARQPTDLERTEPFREGGN